MAAGPARGGHGPKMAIHDAPLPAAGLLLVGDGPGADDVSRLAADWGVSVARGPAVASGGNARCVVIPRARALVPAWWQAPPAGDASGAARSVVVVGGGHTGVEAALRWSTRAERVLLVEAGDRLLPDWDEAVAGHVAALLARRGVTILAGCRAVALEAAAGGVTIRLRRRGAPVDSVESFAAAVPAVGLRPDLVGLGLERTRALADRLGFLQVDSRLETAEPRLHALGAAVALPLTPAVLARQALVVASCAAGRPVAPVRYNLLARAIDGEDGALTAGLSVSGARARGFRVTVGRAGDDAAWVACVRDTETGAALGVHAAGVNAAALAAAATAMLEGAADGALPAESPRAQGDGHELLAAAFAAATRENGTDV